MKTKGLCLYKIWQHKTNSKLPTVDVAHAGYLVPNTILISEIHYNIIIMVDYQNNMQFRLNRLYLALCSRCQALSAYPTMLWLLEAVLSQI